jgi:hypothetical protein
MLKFSKDITRVLLCDNLQQLMNTCVFHTRWELMNGHPFLSVSITCKDINIENFYWSPLEITHDGTYYYSNYKSDVYIKLDLYIIQSALSVLKNISQEYIASLNCALLFKYPNEYKNQIKKIFMDAGYLL